MTCLLHSRCGEMRSLRGADADTRAFRIPSPSLSLSTGTFKLNLKSCDSPTCHLRHAATRNPAPHALIDAGTLPIHFPAKSDSETETHSVVSLGPALQSPVFTCHRPKHHAPTCFHVSPCFFSSLDIAGLFLISTALYTIPATRLSNFLPFTPTEPSRAPRMSFAAAG